MLTISATGHSSVLVASGIPHGGDIGVESAAFVPPGFSAGGTAYVVYRKDRVKCSRGNQFLQGYKIKEKSPTNRVVATCCNSAMFLNFDDGKHWPKKTRTT